MVCSRNSSKIVLSFLLVFFVIFCREFIRFFSRNYVNWRNKSANNLLLWKTIVMLDKRMGLYKIVVFPRRIDSILFRSQQQTNEKSQSRVFLPRNSILTDLFEISHFQSLRNACAATLILLFIQDTITDYIEDGR